MKFEINRATWIRGDNRGILLRTSDGHRCCLGFFLGACGLPDADLINESEPNEVARALAQNGEAGQWPVVAEFLARIEGVDEPVDDEDPFVVLSLGEGELMGVNDDEDLSEPKREAKIAQLFADAGHEAVFVGPVNMLKEEDE